MAVKKNLSQSSGKQLDSDKFSKLESMVMTLAEKVDELASSKAKENQLPRTENPDVKMAAMHEARVGEDPVNKSSVVDRRYPDKKRAFQEGDFITIKPECEYYYEKYKVVYDDRGKPQPVGVNATCEKCGEVWPAGRSKCGNKECKGTLIKDEVPEDAVPAVGMIKKIMYVKKRNKHKDEWKYRVWFDGFGTKDAGGEGLFESEIERWQPSKS